MPTKCSVRGCDSYYAIGSSFFNLPTPLKYKYSLEKAKLSKKRRKLWLEAMKMQDIPSKILRICHKHFLKGKPSALEESRDVDWVPSLYMNLPDLPQDKEKKRTEDKRVKKSLNNSSYSKESRKNSKKKADQKKFLNCKVLLDGKLRDTTFSGTNGSGLAVSQKHGIFTSDNVTLTETAINNTVLRIHLVTDDLNSLKRKYEAENQTTPNKRRRKIQQVSSFGRQIKKKRSFFDYDYDTPQLKKVQTRQPSLSLYDKMENSKSTSFVDTDFTESPQMRRQSTKEEKSSIHSKLHNKSTVVKSTSENRTLNRVIKKNDRDRFKIKFFTASSTPTRKIIRNESITPTRKIIRNESITPTRTIIRNESITKAPGESMELHREILFVKQYKNEKPYTPNASYYLKFPYCRHHEDGKLEYPFQKLVTDVKHMKLPGPTWKIKVIIRQSKIAAITFTNKLLLERCVGFSLTSDRYIIIIDNRPAFLLGSPNAVRNSSELEILLDIIENITPKDPMIYYK